MNNSEAKIDIQLATATLEIVSGLPPLSWLVHCKTPDQAEHWKETKQEFQLLYLALKAYFSGEKSPLQKMTPRERELYEIWADHYIVLYGVIQKGWSYIATAATNLQLEADLGSTPGEAIIRIIEADCAGIFNRCFEYEEWSQDTAYRLYLDWKKLKKSLESKSFEFSALTKSEQNKIKNFQAKLKKMRRNSERFHALENFCIAVCHENAKLDRTLQRKLKEFEAHKQVWASLMTRNVLPKSHGWDGKGNKTQATHAGGVYR
jgi:hypothetical protein